MILVAGDRAQFFSSKNLISWNFTSEFDKNIGAHGGVWECPDIFKLKVVGSNEEKWVLVISINPSAPHGGSGTQYFISEYDGKSFKTKHQDIASAKDRGKLAALYQFNIVFGILIAFTSNYFF